MTGSLLRDEDREYPTTAAEALAALNSKAPRNAIALQACRDKLALNRPTPKDSTPLPFGVMP